MKYDSKPDQNPMTEHPHDKTAPGWIGVDLDGTLASYDGWKGPDHIGEPIPKMVRFVRDLMDQGHEIRIFTARVGPQKQPQDRVYAAQAIRAWCHKHLGKELPTTHEKDFQMLWLYDDRCSQVIRNSGAIIAPNLDHSPEPNYDPVI